MPIVRVPYGNALPTVQDDYVRQNNILAAGFMNVNKPVWEDAANNIVQGAIFQVGGTVYHANAATAIGGAPSDYIKLTPSGDGSSLTPAYVANLAGVTWNSTYNGYYDVGGNAYIFDELVALQAGQIAVINTKLWKAINDLITGNFEIPGNHEYSGDPEFSGDPNFTGDPTYITSNSIQFKVKIINIGDWNMDTANAVNIAHGLTLGHIRSISVSIINDLGSTTYDFAATILNSNGTFHSYGGYIVASTTHITLRRHLGGMYDGNSFDLTPYNRGWITINYEV